MKLFATTFLTFSLSSAPSQLPSISPYIEPRAAIFERGGLAKTFSWTMARIEKSDAENWWELATGQPLGGLKSFVARADCRNGKLKAVDGNEYL